MIKPKQTKHNGPLIYLLTSPSGKCYVGQTMRSFEDRMIKHKSKAKEYGRNRKGFSGCVALCAAINKYGWDSFTKEILLYCDECDLDEHENLFIVEEYKSLAPNGYNLMSGGNSNKRMSAITKKKMSHSAFARNSRKYRKTKVTQDLPKYLQLSNSKYSKGYKISKHPRCSSKHFCDKSKTITENKQDALAFLERLNRGDVTVEHIRTLPLGIQVCGTGYRVYWQSVNFGRVIKNFNNRSNSNAINLAAAKAYLLRTQTSDAIMKK